MIPPYVDKHGELMTIGSYDTEEEDLIASGGALPQIPACDRCTQGVMDATNSHLLGTCSCPCHTRLDSEPGTELTSRPCLAAK